MGESESVRMREWDIRGCEGKRNQKIRGVKRLGNRSEQFATDVSSKIKANERSKKEFSPHNLCRLYVFNQCKLFSPELL